MSGFVNVQTSTGGCPTNFQAALSSTAVAVKTTPGILIGYSIYNSNAAAAYVLYYNTASPTVGTTVPIYGIGLAGGASANFAFPEGGAAGSAIYVLASTSVSSASAPSTGLTVTTMFL